MNISGDLYLVFIFASRTNSNWIVWFCHRVLAFASILARLHGMCIIHGVYSCLACHTADNNSTGRSRLSSLVFFCLWSFPPLSCNMPNIQVTLWDFEYPSKRRMILNPKKVKLNFLLSTVWIHLIETVAMFWNGCDICFAPFYFYFGSWAQLISCSMSL